MTKKDWIIILILPLFVSISTILFEYIINNKIIEISFYENRHRTASPQEENGIFKIVNNDLNELSVSKIELKNTGDVALKNVKIRIKYNEINSDFKLLKSYHKTIPEFEFGEIQELKRKDEIILTYEILNPNEISIIETSIRGNYSNVKLFSKSENLNIHENKYAFSPHKELKYFFQFISIMFSFIIGLMIYLYKNDKKMKQRWKEIEKAVKYYDKKKKKIRT